MTTTTYCKVALNAGREKWGLNIYEEMLHFQHCPKTLCEMYSSVLDLSENIEIIKQNNNNTVILIIEETMNDVVKSGDQLFLY